MRVCDPGERRHRIPRNMLCGILSQGRSAGQPRGTAQALAAARRPISGTHWRCGRLEPRAIERLRTAYLKREAPRASRSGRARPVTTRLTGGRFENQAKVDTSDVDRIMKD